MQTECISGQLEFEGFDGRRVVAAFDGGAVTSDAGALLLRETDRAIRLIERVAACFSDGRDPGSSSTRCRHWSASACCDRARLRGCQRPRPVTLRSGAGVVRRQPRGQAQGLCAAGGQEYETGWNMPLATDAPAITRSAAIARRCRTCSSTSSSMRTARRRGRSCSTSTPPTIPCTAKEGRFFHGHMTATVLAALRVLRRQLLAAKLRRSNIDAAAGAKDEVARIIARIRRRWPKVRILLRADTGFAARS